MPDILTEAQEQELLEAAVVMKEVLATLDPEQSQAKMIQIAETLGALEEIIADEDPSPKLCPNNHPSHLPNRTCEFNHLLIGDTGYCSKENGDPTHRPLLEVQI